MRGITALVVALIAAPFLWFRLQPDFALGNVSLVFAPANGLRFLGVLLPGALTGLVLAGLLHLWARFGPRKPVIATGMAHLLEHPAQLGLATFFLCSLGLVLSPNGLSIGTFVCLHMVLTLGLNITIGMTGLLVLGYASFYAIGAYSFALAQTHLPGFPILAALPLGAAMAGMAGGLVGLTCLRLRGDYLAIVTLGFAEAFRELVRNLSVTGGDMGITFAPASRIPSLGPLLANQIAWMGAVLLTVVVVLLVLRLYHARIGRAWIAIREDEIAASAMGIPVVRLKLLAFGISSAIAGLAGAYFAGFTGFVDPSLGTFEQSVLILAMVILGGLGSIPGSLVGAALLYLTPNLLRDQFPAIAEFRLLFFGVILVTMMLFRPQGLLGSPRHKLEMEGK